MGHGRRTRPGHRRDLRGHRTLRPSAPEKGRLFAVDRHRKPGPAGRRHAPGQRVGVAGGEFRPPAVAQERLEAHHAAVQQRPESVRVLRDEPTPESEVDQRRPLGLFPLRHDGVGTCRGRVRVDGHVDDGGDAARGGRQAARRPSLPVVATRRVEVHVGVDRAREQGQARGVDHLGGGSAGAGLGHRDDGAIGDHDITRRATEQASAYDQFGLHRPAAVSGSFVSIE